jgi:DNA polymerase-1
MSETKEIVSDKPYISLDIETTGLDPIKDRIEGISLGWLDDEADNGAVGTYFRFVGQNAESLIKFKRTFRDIFGKRYDNQYCVMHNATFDASFLQYNDFEIKNKIIDTMVLVWMLDQERSNGLKTVVKEEFDYQMTEYEEVADPNMHTLFTDRFEEYGADDSKWTIKVFEKFYKRLKEEELTEQFHKIYMELIPVLVDMKLRGVYVDLDMLHDINENIEEKAREIRDKVHEKAGKEFLLTSPDQIAEVLYEDMGINPENFNITENKTGYSTAKSELKKLARAGYEIPELILEYRKYQKLKSTYSEPIIEYVEQYDDSRLRGWTKVGATSTGRLASSDPNLQNIPSHQDDESIKIRKAFQAEDGKKLIVSDLSQIELRLMGHFSRDRKLLKVYNEDHDIHDMTADNLGVSRDIGKTVNYSVLYKIGAEALQTSLKDEGVDVTESEAQDYIDGWFDTYSGVNDFYANVRKQLIEKNYVLTLTGRKRYFTKEEITRDNVWKYERFAGNSVIQGSGADLINLSTVNLDKRIKENNLPMDILLSVHDELVVEADEEHADEMAEIVTYELEEPVDISVPIESDTEIVKDWASGK